MYKVFIKFRCGNEIKCEVDGEWVSIDTQTGQVRQSIGNSKKVYFTQDDVLWMTVEKIA